MVLDAVRQTVERLIQPLGFNSLALLLSLDLAGFLLTLVCCEPTMKLFGEQRSRKSPGHRRGFRFGSVKWHGFSS